MKDAINEYRSQGQGPREGGHNVRNRLSATRWQVTPRILSDQATPPITFHEPRYMNTIKLFGHRPGTAPRKALSHQMDRMFAEVLSTARTTSADFPHLNEVANEIATLEQKLGCPSTGRMPIDHQATITTPTSGIRSTEGYAEELTFTPPSDMPQHLIPSTRNAADHRRGVPFLQDIL